MAGMKDATPEQIQGAISMADSLQVLLQENERLNEENEKLREVIGEYNMEHVNHLKTVVFLEWWQSLPADPEREREIEKVFNRCQFLEAENSTYQKLMEKYEFRLSLPLFSEFDRWFLSWKTMFLLLLVVVLSVI